MAIKPLATLLSDINTIFPDNAPVGSITMAMFRSWAADVVQSAVNIATNTNLQGFYPYDVTVQYQTGQIVQYDYKWYKANTVPPVGAFDSTKWDLIGLIKYTKTITIPTAQVLTLNTVPVLAIPAISSRTIRLINAKASISYNGVAYATQTTIQAYTNTATLVQGSIVNFLAATVSTSMQFKPNTATPISTDTQLISGQGIYINVLGQNPTLGNSDVTVTLDHVIE